MKVLAKITLVVGDKEYAPDSIVEIPNDKEAKSLIKRKFASTVSKAVANSYQHQNSLSDKDKTNDDNERKENDSSGSTISESGK